MAFNLRSLGKVPRDREDAPYKLLPYRVWLNDYFFTGQLLMPKMA
jgi:hypothetical protein